MPSAPLDLQNKFPGMDQEALEVIDANYSVGKGFVIRPKVAGYKPTERENDALNYLWLEWDFAFEGC